LLLDGLNRHFEDAFLDSFFDEFGKVAFAAAAVVGEELAEGCVSFGGDYQIPAGLGCGHGLLLH
jgi:hypothetical protein